MVRLKSGGVTVGTEVDIHGSLLFFSGLVRSVAGVDKERQEGYAG